MSSYCSVCGCAQFTLIDGFFYCAICSTQSQVHREMDMEDANLVDNMAAIIATKVTTKKSAEESQKRRSSKKYQPNEEQKITLAAVETEDYPRFVKRCGLRLATFTKLLSRYSNILIRDFNVPPTIRDHALSIFQRYLRHLKVAFCDEEIDEKNPYCPLVKNNEYEAQIKEKQERLKLEKERNLHSGRNILSQLTSSDIDENLSVQTTRNEVVEQGDVQMVMEIHTKLSVEAFRRLLIIPLSHEILLVISYLACLCAGATWILLSDITRWYREGRLPMSFSQRCALIPLVAGDGDDSHRCSIVSVTAPIVCLSEMMRFVLAVSQMTDIPVQPITIDFDQIVCRFCFNLNLPSVFLERVRALNAHLRPNCDFSERLTKRFGEFDSSVLLDYALSPSLFNVDFGFENRQSESLHNYTGERNLYHCMLPTPEAKAIALILFALKLTFALDDRREYSMIQRNCDGDESYECFDFPLWMHQLKMRMDVWCGRTLKNVLEERKHLSATPLIDEDIKRVRWATTHDGRKVPRYLGKPCISQDTAFKGCVPNYVVNEAKQYAFYSTFADDIEPRPTEWLDKEALLAPLRYQATRNDEWYENLLEEERRGDISEQAALIDRYNADLFFKSFKKCAMNYEECISEKCDQETIHCTKFKGGCETDEQRLRWRHLFPCSRDYISYPRPLFSRHLIKWQKRGSNIYAPIIYAKALDLLMRTARIAFSDTFTSLLDSLSLIIGEEQKIVYAYMLMIEMMFVNCQTVEELKKLIENNDELITYAQLGSLDYPPEQAKITLRRINDNVNTADYRYEIIEFGEFVQCATDQQGTFMLYEKNTEWQKRSMRKRRATRSTDARLRKTYGLRRTKASRLRRSSNAKNGEIQDCCHDDSSRRSRSTARRGSCGGDEAEAREEDVHQRKSRDVVDEERGAQIGDSDGESSEWSTEGLTDNSFDVNDETSIVDCSEDQTGLTGEFKRLILNTAKRPARPSCSGAAPQPEALPSCSTKGKRRQRQQNKRQRSNSKRAQYDIEKGAKRRLECLEFEFETAFTLALLKYW